MIRRLAAVALGLLLGPAAFLGAQGFGLDGFDSEAAERLIRDALSITAEVNVTGLSGAAEPWRALVDKITLPGRAVSVSLNGGDAFLDVHFTPYPGEGGRVILVAQSETWTVDEAGERRDFQRAITSLPLAYGEEVLYYPLGRAGQETGDGLVEVRISLLVRPYLETLSDEDREALASAFEESSLLDVTGEDG